jgi:DNA polymerase-1
MAVRVEDAFRSLGYRHVWCVDFEFVAPRGHKPRPVCMVAKCAITGAIIKLWGAQLALCPFDVTDDVLFVAYYASAESSCFDVLGWPHPRRVLDLFAEFRRITNGAGVQHGNGLIGALLHFGLPTIGGEDKDEMRALIMRDEPWSEPEKSKILEYCESDVDALLRLLEPMIARVGTHHPRFGQALLRGRYMAAAGIVENNGIPIDVALLSRLMTHWDFIKLKLIEAVDRDYGVYEGNRFVTARFEAYLTRMGIAWPRLPSGALAQDDETFRQQARIYPKISPLRELRHTLGQLRLNDLSVGPDGRNRTMLSAFRARTSRNQPSTSRFIFGASVWLRHLIKPSAGRAVAYIDFAAQEIAIAAALSGDERLWEAYASGDPYLAFARQAGLVPPDATKSSHPEERKRCKAIVLGVNYGMGAESIASQAQIHVIEARELLLRHRETYRVFWNWAEANVEKARLGLPLETVFGWQLHPASGGNNSFSARSVLNWPMQSHGAEMLRLAISMAVEEGLKVCAPVHDALLFEAPIHVIEEQATRLATIMGDASEIILGAGRRCRLDIKIVRHPDRYEDEDRGREMFERVMELLAEAEKATESRDCSFSPSSKVKGSTSAYPPPNRGLAPPEKGVCMKPYY